MIKEIETNKNKSFSEKLLSVSLMISRHYIFFNIFFFFFFKAR